MIDTIVKSIKEHEEFVDHVYKDSLGFDTVGYGTKMPLSKQECSMILEHRLKQKIKHLQDAKPFIVSLPNPVQEVLYEMSYQMGVGGVLKFKNTWRYLEDWEFKKASEEMLDSKWARSDSPRRARELSDRLREVVKND